MIVLIWICLMINIGAAVFLFVCSLGQSQDAAGKGIIYLPALLLIGLTVLSYYLAQKNHLGWALAASGIPTIILLYVLYISIS